MRDFIEALSIRQYQKRKIAIIENGTWAPAAAKGIKAVFATAKDIEFVEPVVTIKGALNDDTLAQIAQLAKAIA